MTVRSPDFYGDIPDITVSDRLLVQLWHPEHPDILLAELGNVQARQYAHQLLAAANTSLHLSRRKYA